MHQFKVAAGSISHLPPNPGRLWRRCYLLRPGVCFRNGARKTRRRAADLSLSPPTPTPCAFVSLAMCVSLVGYETLSGSHGARCLSATSSQSSDRLKKDIYLFWMCIRASPRPPPTQYCPPVEIKAVTKEMPLYKSWICIFVLFFCSIIAAVHSDADHIWFYIFFFKAVVIFSFSRSGDSGHMTPRQSCQRPVASGGLMDEEMRCPRPVNASSHIVCFKKHRMARCWGLFIFLPESLDFWFIFSFGGLWNLLTWVWLFNFPANSSAIGADCNAAVRGCLCMQVSVCQICCGFWFIVGKKPQKLIVKDSLSVFSFPFNFGPTLATSLPPQKLYISLEQFI